MRISDVEVPPEVRDDTLKAFLRLYQLETWMREMVYLEVKSYYGMQWLTEVENALLRAKLNIKMATKSAARDKKHQHISTAETDPLWYISFESLLKIIYDAKMWKLFASYFTTKKVFRVRLEEILPIRNRVAHCRALHTYDVDRLTQFLRDFDQGFWRFCATYGDEYVFANRLSNNKVIAHFGAVRDADLYINYSARPYTRDRAPKRQLGPGFIYDVTIRTRHLDRYFEYDRILRATRSWHKYVLHIMLDSFQHSLRVTFPGTLGSTTVIEAIERFIRVAHNTYSVVPLVPLAQGVERQSEPDATVDYAARNRPFDAIAAGWPHYVVPPSHPFTFIDSSCPCSFFGA